MIQSKNDLLLFLEADRIALGRYNRKKPKWSDFVWQFEVSLRKCEYYKNCKKGFINKLILKYHMFKYKVLSYICGYIIPLNVFDRGLSLAHQGTIQVNSGARVGKYCRLHMGISIGPTAGTHNICPKIGDNVYIGPGAILFGDIEIADNIAIGANAVVNKSFTENRIFQSEASPRRKLAIRGG